RSRDLRAPRGPLLRGRRRRSRAAADVPRGGPHRSQAPPVHLPEQYWGGPKTYGAERGHPRLRMRHAVFPVSPSARDAWLRHMRTALDSLELAPLHEQTLWDYLDRAAQSLVNTVDGGEAPAAGQAVPGRLS